MYDHITPEQWVIFLALAIPLTTIGFASYYWMTMHEDDKAAIMSRLAPLLAHFQKNQTEQRSDAVEPGREPSGTEGGNLVPDILERLEALDDDQLLDILALLRDDQGEYRFAESRVAKFIPGRVEDRLTQVREIRGTEKPLPPGRVLRVRDNSGERVIPFSEGKKVAQ